ncbi:hypothetical protein CLV98_109176 [Dyadobacter jejuensis]|uniref:Uncharacterized protein n=1 Tax=Dyadobacter jejuensis TaxID=1082580 RepID=A0A316AGY3_9BACT|nr:hypothetical protein CLV98_109176 [Dyadobacter jejuensis]
MNKIALRVAIIFFVFYGITSTIGSIFLVSWGGNSKFKQILLFFESFPIDWNRLIVDYSTWFLLLNILFWSSIVYILCIVILKFTTTSNTKNNK